MSVNTESNVVRLHLAKSLKQLNAMIDDPKVDVTKNEVRMLMKSIERMYNAARDSLRQGDEERAYILYMRTAQVYMKAKNRSDFDTYCKVLFGEAKVLECVNVAEKLMKSLERRYQALQESNTVSTKPETDEQKITSTANGNHVNCRKSANDESFDPLESKRILCTELFDWIEQFKVKQKEKASSLPEAILLIDARSGGDFRNSCMKFDSKQYDTSKVNVINIPETVLQEGLTIRKLVESVPTEAGVALRKRSSAKIVIFDWSSNKVQDSKSLDVLFKALWKFDNTAERAKSVPMVLQGGYQEWVITYPTYTTNSKVSAPKPIGSPPKTEAKSVNFDLLLETISDTPKEPPKPVVNGVIGKEVEIKRSGVQIITEKFNNLLNDNPSIRAPGSAKMIPTVDRTKKPSVTSVITPPPKQPEVPVLDDTAKEMLRLKKEKEKEEEMRRDVQAEEEASRQKVQKLEEDNRKLLEENVTLKRNFKPVDTGGVKALPNGDISASEDTRWTPGQGSEVQINGERSPLSSRRNGLGGDEVIHPLTKKSPVEGRALTERTMSESTGPRRSSLVGHGFANLSRSHSSPNIAQLLQEEDEEEAGTLIKSKSTTQTPHFDRTLKPVTLSNDFAKSHSASSARSRNFNPVYGIAGKAITGLRNLGNTCFMNSVIQCLANTVELANYFVNEEHLNDINRNSKFGSKGEIAEELGALIRQMDSCQYKSLAPKDFKNYVGIHMPFFVGNDQQDAHEFLVMLLEKLHADLNRGSRQNDLLEIKDDVPTHIAIKTFWDHHVARNNSMISKLFEGLLLSTLTCETCGKTSNSFEVFSCLSLPIPSVMGNRCNLLDCLKLFSEPEHLSGEAAWDCPTCKTKRDAIKKIVICRLPRVLLIHLKRFSYEGMWRQKLQTAVEFPLNDLNLKNYRYINQNDNSHSLTYNLYGVVNHYGTLEGGHYIAYCKNAAQKKWYKFDDHEVSELNTSDVRSQAAYVLFYTSNL